MSIFISVSDLAGTYKDVEVINIRVLHATNPEDNHVIPM